MKHILIFEEFTDDTINKNNSEYDNYFNRYKLRSQMVAWDVPRSQYSNFNMVSKMIPNDHSILDYGCGLGDFIKHLNNKGITYSDYLGVDINTNFINTAKKSYPDNEFQLITSVDSINGNYDTVCVIGVFTWFITKDDFVKTINKLYELANKQVLITLLYKRGAYYNSKHDEYWESKYRKYDEQMFETLFPNMKFVFNSRNGNTILVKIIK